MADTTRVEDVPHSKIGMSSYDRWYNCPGSVRLIASLGPGAGRAGSAAAEGTVAHRVGELALTEDHDLWEYIGRHFSTDGFTFTVTAEMADAVQLHVTHINDIVEIYVKVHGEVSLKGERRLSSALHDDAFGTCDVSIEVPDAQIIHINDYKHGAGIKVEADAGQIKGYGAMALENATFEVDYDKAHVILEVSQPRIPDSRGVIRSVRMAARELRDLFVDDTIPAASIEAARQAGVEPA